MDNLAEKLRKEVKEAPNPEIVDPIWEQLYGRIRHEILTKDPSGFLRWPVILKCLHIGAGKSSMAFYRELKKRKDFGYWKDVFKESATGKPVLFSWDKTASGTSVAHAAHLSRFQDKTGLKVSEMKHVFEFGGGYGSMRRLIHRMGFDGDYVIYDMPVISALQRYYLGMLGIEAECVSDLDEAQELIKDYAIDQSLFIATASLSETPYELRDQVKPMMWGFKGILISYIHRFGILDNIAYFKEWRESKDYQWFNFSSDTTRDNRAYLFGRKE